MNPASSIIIFTVFSGLGFGMLSWLGFGFLGDKENSIFFYAIAFMFSMLGLVSSTFHLGNPQRALLAFTQWRSSWLSREAILSIFALSINAIYAVAVIFFGFQARALGFIGSFFALATIFSTAMIYAQMKTVPRWCSKFTPITFLLYALIGSSIIPAINEPKSIIIVSSGFILLGLFQTFIWLDGDGKFEKGSNIGTATGLSYLGVIRLLEPPHTGSNYLMKEMIYIVAQKHIQKLRFIALILSSIIPFIFFSAGYLLGNPSLLVFLTGLFIHLCGTIVIRWLFFAEAEHVVGLYYDR
jgi:DMSO reductase anchor subunit